MKQLVLLGSLVLALGFFAACGSNKKETKETTQGQMSSGSMEAGNTDVQLKRRSRAWPWKKISR